jgi:hypothetical protein
MHTLVLVLLFLIVSNSIGIIGIFACIKDVENKVSKLLEKANEDATIREQSKRLKESTDSLKSSVEKNK